MSSPLNPTRVVDEFAAAIGVPESDRYTFGPAFGLGLIFAARHPEYAMALVRAMKSPVQLATPDATMDTFVSTHPIEAAL